jgi:NitT/TauT family transport system substrate-binding protein
MHKKLGIGLLVLVALAAVVFFVSQPAEQEAVGSMEVGYLPVLVNLPLFTALENGYFEKYGLTVEAVEAQSPNHIVEAIVAGNLDGAGVLAYPLLFAAEAEHPGSIKLFASGDEVDDRFVSAILVREDAGIEKVEDLKGKKIGVYTGLVQVLFLKSILIGMGLDPERDVEIVEIAPNLQLQGLEAGHYEALSTVEPFQTIAASQGIGRVLVENPRVRYVQNPFPSVATPLSAEFIEKRPEAARAYLLAYRDAIDFIKDHPEEAKAYLAKFTPISQDIARNVRLLRFNQFGEEDRANVQRNADWMFEQGLLSRSIDIDAMFGDPALLRE